jgi:hypothetical protein
MTIETYCDHRSRTRRIGPTYHLNEKDGGALLSQAAATAVQFNLAIIAILYRAQCSLHTISPTSSHGVHKTASTILRTSSTSGVNLCYCTPTVLRNPNKKCVLSHFRKSNSGDEYYLFLYRKEKQGVDNL